jgi:hypothetical protein
VSSEFAVWTGTTAVLTSKNDLNCNSWKAGGVLFDGAIGRADKTGGEWVYYGTGSPHRCDYKNRLYCFEK